MSAQAGLWRVGVIIILAHVAAGRAAADQPGIKPFRAEIYQQMSDQFAANPAYSGLLTALTQAHEKIAGAVDDPQWARSTERQILEMLAADPAGEELDVRSVTCRRTGCEVDFFETNPSTTKTEPPSWVHAVDRMRLSDLGASVEMDANFQSKSGNSVMFVMTFRRKADSNYTPPLN